MKYAFALAALLTAYVAGAQTTWPSKPIRIIAPAAAGSGTDLAARMIAQHMSMTLKQPVLVENRVGGGGTVAVEYVVKSPPDGYTLLLSTDATVAIQPHVSQVSYDTLTDLAPIGEIASFPLMIVAGADHGISSIADLVRVAKASPKGLSYGVGGIGTGGHIVGETVRISLGIPLTMVPYPSAARAVNDALGGFVELAMSDTSAVPHVRSGKLMAVAVASASRAVCLDTVPTLAEQGVPFDLPYSYGLLAPAKTPKEVIDRLNIEMNAALQTDLAVEHKKRACLTSAPKDNKPEDFANRLKYHHARWGAMIRLAGIKLTP